MNSFQKLTFHCAQVALFLAMLAGCSSPSGIQGQVGSQEYFIENGTEMMELEKNGQFEEARAIYESLNSYYGGNPKYIQQLNTMERILCRGEAAYWADKEQWEKAIPLERRAVHTYDPQNYESLAGEQSILAKYLFKAGRKKEALEMAKSAVQTNPDRVDHYILVHDIYLDLAGEEPNNVTYLEGAIQYLTHAQKIEPENPSVQKKVEMWESTFQEDLEGIAPPNKVE